MCIPTSLGYLSPWVLILLLPLLELPGNFASIHRTHLLSHVFLLPFSVVCRPPYPPSRTAWLFCRDPWTSRVSPRLFLTFPWSVVLLVPLLELSGYYAWIHGSCVAPCVLGYLSPWSAVLLLPLLELPGNFFAKILGPHVLPHVFLHVFLLSLSVVCRPLSPPSWTSWQFCRDPWISRVSPPVTVTFLRGLSSSLSPFSNYLAILPGSLDLTCCPTCSLTFLRGLSSSFSLFSTAGQFCRGPWTSRVAPRVSNFLLPFSVVCCPPFLPSRTAWLFCRDPWTSLVSPRVLGYLSPWSVVLLIPLLELPGNFAGILGPHVYFLCPKVVSFLLLLLQLAKLFLINKTRF